MHSAFYIPIVQAMLNFQSKLALLAVITASMICGCGKSEPQKPSPASPEVPQAKFVGSNACATCHEAENHDWMGSHHQLAMQEATAETVLGDFNDVKYDHYGIKSRFFKDGDRFVVNTEGPDGKNADYPVEYVFGVYPLQQYLIQFSRGRLQVLHLCWDSRPKEEGGQR